MKSGNIVLVKKMKYGYIRIKLEQLIRNEKISKNKLGQRAEMQRTQINKYCNNEVTRLDTAVLVRICTVFHCTISDLLEFVESKDDDSFQ